MVVGQTIYQTVKGRENVTTYKADIGNIEAKTGKTSEDFLKIAKEKDLVKYGELLEWLKRDCGLGHGHAIILYIQNRN
jgi:hypothetical protein